jgi:hypothetical protein
VNSSDDPLLRLPPTTSVHVAVENLHRVAENLVVDTAQAIVATRCVYGLADQRQVEEEDFPPFQSRSVKWFTESSSQSKSE